MNSVRPLFPVFFIALALAASGAQARNREKTGIDAPPSWPSQAVENDFGAMVVIATLAERERFEEEWYSTATEHAPSLTEATEARRGDKVSISFLFSNCAEDGTSAETFESGKAACNALLDARIVAPDGTVYGKAGDAGDLRLAGDAPAAPPKIVQLSPVNIVIRFEPHDLPGKYRVEATIDNPDRDALLRIGTSIELLADDTDTHAKTP